MRGLTRSSFSLEKKTRLNIPEVPRLEGLGLGWGQEGISEVIAGDLDLQDLTEGDTSEGIWRWRGARGSEAHDSQVRLKG